MTKAVFFSLGNKRKIHSLSEEPEVDGFKEKAKQQEKVQYLLNKAVESIVWDIKTTPPKRRALQ